MTPHWGAAQYVLLTWFATFTVLPWVAQLLVVEVYQVPWDKFVATQLEKAFCWGVVALILFRGGFF